MRKQHMLLTLILVILLPYAAVTPAGAAEMRGLWVDAFHPGFKTPEQTSAMVAKARSCGFNALFVQVRKRGDVYYRSSVEPLAKDSQVGYDALADIITKAHAAGLEVHAWISVYEVYRDSKWSKSDAGMVHLRHPEWIMKDEFGKAVFPGEKVYLDPALPDVNTYLVGLVDEIVRGYDIDGIHLDNVRYPAQEGGYSEAGISRFNSESGRTGKPASDDQAWCNWRKAQVTQFVQAVYQRATSIRRQVKVSAAVFANREDAAGHRFQDWEAWLRAGILDFAVPMNFALDTRVFEMKCSDAKTLSTGRAIYMGQGAYKMGADAAVDQIATARSAGFGGVVVYSYAYCLNPRGEDAISVMDALKAGPFAQADTVPTLSWKQ